MRSQSCTIQQTLTAEAAAVVKQAVGLAKRRGHAQVTPLHVAHTMLLGSSSGLFRAACLQAHSHPLQCRALELCFNVALQRLPTSTVCPGLGPTCQPGIANALVAAFKRAQAHQRRGVIENNQQQQQTILGVKIELEQLVISILDDPSVSRVMKEAGFSSPLVKSKVEEALISSNTKPNQNAIPIPAGSLNSSLIPDRKIEFKEIGGCNRSESTTSNLLPPWLQKYKEEKSKRDQSNNNDQDSLIVKDLTRWSSFCTTDQPSKSLIETSLSFSSISPSSTLNFSPYNFRVNEVQANTHHDPNKDHHTQQSLTTIRMRSSNPSSSTPTPTSSTTEIREQMESQCVLFIPRFNEYNTDNLKTICNALEQKAPSQKDIIFDIASTILHCRSGKTTRKANSVIIKEDTWLFFEGGDIEAKEKIARELATLIFGSEDKFVSIGLFSNFSLEDSRNKRLRDQESCSYVERFAEEISNNPHRVFLVEDLDQVDYSSQLGFKKAIERGKITKYLNQEEVCFYDAIIILSCERFRSRSRACSPSIKLNEDGPKNANTSLDLNISINYGGEDEEIDPKFVRYDSRDEIGLLAVVDRCIFFKNRQN